jgi:uncharacterized membrane protein (DUF106 family)
MYARIASKFLISQAHPILMWIIKAVIIGPYSVIIGPCIVGTDLDVFKRQPDLYY